MGFKSDGVKWTWSDDTTTPCPNWHTTTINIDESELEEITKKFKESQLTIEAVPPVKPPVQYGWVCPKCGRVNAPWVSQCGCQGSIFKKIDTWSSSGIPEACRNCSNHPSNGGSGICLCTLGTPKITC